MTHRFTAIACATSFVVGASLVWAQQTQQASKREPQFENAQVHAWKTTIMPNQPLALHRHDHARALIALTDGRINVVDGAGKALTTYNWVKGKAYWLEADPPGQMHADLNKTTKPIEVIVVELQRDK